MMIGSSRAQVRHVVVTEYNLLIQRHLTVRRLFATICIQLDRTKSIYYR
jgi:hypothetical protein